MVRWCWVNLQCRGILKNWVIVGQGHTVLAFDAGEACLDIFPSSIIYLFFLRLFHEW